MIEARDEGPEPRVADFEADLGDVHPAFSEKLLGAGGAQRIEELGRRNPRYSLERVRRLESAEAANSDNPLEIEVLIGDIRMHVCDGLADPALP